MPKPLQRLRILLFSALLGLGLGACVEDNPLFDPDPAGENAGGCTQGREITEPSSAFERPDQIDVLFVVSDAPDTSALQDRLSAAVPRLVGLMQAEGLDWQMGFIGGDASSPATTGALRAATQRPGCMDAPRLIRATDGDKAGPWAACNALVGSSGSHTQKPMEAAVEALTTQASSPLESRGNAGFLRPRARLLVVFVTDRDDCSGEVGVVDASARRSVTECAKLSDDLSPPASFAQQLLALKQDPASISVAVLGGPDTGRSLSPDETLEPACQQDALPVYPTTRLIELADLFAPQTEFEPAWAPSYGVSIAHIARLTDPQPIQICAEARITDPLVKVTVLNDDKNTQLSAGAQGFLYLGPSATCDNGIIQISPDAIQGDSSLELRYCTR